MPPPEKESPLSSRWVVLPYQPKARSDKIKGLRRHSKAYETYKTPRAGFAMPTVGVTVVPKRVLAKHRTNQTTNCHSPAKNRKSRSRDHQQHKQKMKETKRKQKHPNWVVCFRRRRRNATATKQTSPKRYKKHRNEKDWQTLPKQKKEGKPVYTYAYTNTLKAEKLTHCTWSTYPKCTFNSFESWILGCSTCKGRSTKASATETQTAGMQHTTHL